MSYRRVIPRDLFNEANLLKCYGQLWLHLEGHPRAELRFDSEGTSAPFYIQQDDGDGSLTISNVTLRVGIRRWALSRPLNSRDPWPLYATDQDGNETEVFDDNGALSEAFRLAVS